MLSRSEMLVGIALVLPTALALRAPFLPRKMEAAPPKGFTWGTGDVKGNIIPTIPVLAKSPKVNRPPVAVPPPVVTTAPEVEMALELKPSPIAGPSATSIVRKLPALMLALVRNMLAR